MRNLTLFFQASALLFTVATLSFPGALAATDLDPDLAAYFRAHQEAVRQAADYQFDSSEHDWEDFDPDNYQEEVDEASMELAAKHYKPRRKKLTKQGKHFVDSVDVYGDDFIEDHATVCKVCNPLVNTLLKFTPIANIPLDRGPAIGSYCVVGGGGGCPMAVPIRVGAPCFCATYQGPIWGVVR